jgi:soluble lytic murein transglycosylase
MPDGVLKTMVRIGFATLTCALAGLPSLAHGSPTALKTAREALERNEPKAAIVALEGGNPALSDWRALWLGRALAADGQTEAAIRALREVQPAPKEPVPCRPNCVAPAFPSAQETLAELIAPLEGARMLLDLPATGPRLDRAVLRAREAKDTKLEAEAEQRLLTLVPESLEARTRAQVLGLDGIVLRLGTRERRMARVRQLLETHQSEAAHAEARALLEGAAPKESCELQYIMGKAARKMRQYPLAIEALGQARKLCQAGKSDDFERRTLLLEAQVRGIRRHLSALAKLTETLEKRYPKHSFVDDALFLLAETQDRSGKAALAERSYRRIIEEYPDGDHAVEAGWRLAYQAFAAGKYDVAAPLLESGAKHARGTRDAARARYWRGRIAQLRGGEDAARACDDFEAAAFEPPLTFYTWLALSETERSLPKCGQRIRARLDELRASAPKGDAAGGSLSRHPQVSRARQLAEAGMTEAAISELALLEHPGLSMEEVISLAFEYDAVGGHKEAQWLLRTRAQETLARAPAGKDLLVWRAAYSRPFWPEIEKAATGMKLDPLLLMALVREESTFDPEIVSWAGATGLAQLMPGTAMTAYADLKRGKLDLERLVEPALNVELGAYVLRSGLRRFGQQAPLALAAYNGGPGLAAKTLPKESDYPFDRWSEEVFVKETRKYVQRVMGTYGIYRFLYASEAPLLTLPPTVPGRRDG